MFSAWDRLKSQVSLFKCSVTERPAPHPYSLPPVAFCFACLSVRFCFTAHRTTLLAIFLLRALQHFVIFRWPACSFPPPSLLLPRRLALRKKKTGPLCVCLLAFTGPFSFPQLSDPIRRSCPRGTQLHVFCLRRHSPFLRQENRISVLLFFVSFPPPSSLCSCNRHTYIHTHTHRSRPPPWALQRSSVHQ